MADISQMSDAELSVLWGGPNGVAAKLADGRSDAHEVAREVNRRIAAGWRNPSSVWYDPKRALEENREFGSFGYEGEHG